MLPQRFAVRHGDNSMNSPFRWCMALAVLLASWSTQIMAQEDESVEDDGGSYVLTEPFQFTEPDAGVRFIADVLIWTRTNSGNSGPVIGGPESFTFSPLSNSYVGGYRLGAAWLIDPNYEVEGVWTSFSDWTANSGGVLSRAIAFNGGQASPLVDPSGNANFINTGTFFRPVFDAAMDPLANPAIQNYAFLNGGSTFAMTSTSTLHDAQVNFKTRRSAVQRFSYGLGYRNINLSESSTVGISGVFGTSDLPAGGNTHNTLSDAALTAHGLTLLSGAADGWTNGPGTPTTLTLMWNGATTNQLNGAQGTIDANLWQRGLFTLEGLVRAGVFMNHISGAVREVYSGGGADNSVYGRSLTDSRDVVAFASNLGLNGVFAVSNHVKLRAGYELMFLTNAALSGNQQSGVTYNSLGTANYSVQGGSTVIFHGARAGVEVVW